MARSNDNRFMHAASRDVSNVYLDAAVISAIESFGYEVRSDEFEIGIEGMTCASCVRRVERRSPSYPASSPLPSTLPGSSGPLCFAHNHPEPSSARAAFIESCPSRTAFGQRDLMYERAAMMALSGSIVPKAGILVR